MGDLGIEEGDPGQRRIVDLCGKAQQGAADDEAGVIACDVRELRAAGDVADGIGLAVAGAQAGIDGNALGREDDAGCLQPQPFDIGLAASRDQKVGAGDGSLAVPVRDPDRDASSIAAHGIDLDRLAQVEAVLTQTAPDQFRSLRLVARQDDVALQHGHGGPEAPEGL